MHARQHQQRAEATAGWRNRKRHLVNRERL
jgi:hypothetical protein